MMRTRKKPYATKKAYSTKVVIRTRTIAEAEEYLQARAAGSAAELVRQRRAKGNKKRSFSTDRVSYRYAIVRDSDTSGNRYAVVRKRLHRPKKQGSPETLVHRGVLYKRGAKGVYYRVDVGGAGDQTGATKPGDIVVVGPSKPSGDIQVGPSKPGGRTQVARTKSGGPRTRGKVQTEHGEATSGNPES